MDVSLDFQHNLVHSPNDGLRGITTHLAIIIFASSLGRWVDHAPSRLRTLLTTVSVNRVVVIAACVCWAIIITKDVDEKTLTSIDGATASADARPLKLHQWKDTIFLLILALGILERLSRLTNLTSIERDWVPTMAATSSEDKQQLPYDLSHLNALMSRIDLICKLGSPIAISAFMSATKSPRLGAVLLIGLNFLTWPFEYWTARAVWHGNEQLQEEKIIDGSEVKELAATENWTCASLSIVFTSILGCILQYGRSIHQYFATEVWMPSLAISSLHFSVLVFSSTLIVFLVNSGFSMSLITWAEVLSAAFELSGTFIFPWAVRVLSNEPTAYHSLSDDEPKSTPTTPLRSTFEIADDTKEYDVGSLEQSQVVGVSKLGLLAIFLTLIALIPSVPAIWHIATSSPLATTIPNKPSSSSSSASPPNTHTPIALILVLIIFISASRLGRFTSVLCAQQLAQTCVEPAQRSRFAGTEAGFASVFGLGHYVATVVWSEREDFRWVALGSVIVVAAGVGLYALWLLGRGKRLGR